MIKPQTSKLFIITLLALGMYSCAVDDVTTDDPVFTFPDPIEILATSILGSLEDEAGLPISNAVVICSNCLTTQTTLSDEKGDFQFLDVEVKGDSGFLTVRSEGKFDAFRRIGLLGSRNNYTRILMKEKESISISQINLYNIIPKSTPLPTVLNKTY